MAECRPSAPMTKSNDSVLPSANVTDASSPSCKIAVAVVAKRKSASSLASSIQHRLQIFAHDLDDIATVEQRSAVERDHRRAISIVVPRFADHRVPAYQFRQDSELFGITVRRMRERDDETIRTNGPASVR